VSFSDKITQYPDDMSSIPKLCEGIICAFLFIEKGSLSEERLVSQMKLAQKQFDKKGTKFIVVDGLCYLDKIQNQFGIGFDDLPKFAVWDSKNKRVYRHHDTIDAIGFQRTVIKVSK
jgi:hypothetical protein